MPDKKQNRPKRGGGGKPVYTDGASQTMDEGLRFRQRRYLGRRSNAASEPRDDLWIKGVKHLGRMRVDVKRGTLLGGPGPAPAVAGGLRWKQIGPQPLQIDAEQNFQGAGPASGEVVDIAIDPRGATDQVIYIATNDGGIWKTTDGGTTWKPKTDPLPSLSMGAVALDPNDPDIVYAGTGNPFDGGSVFSKGVGIYRSIDAGETWSHVGAAVLQNLTINRIVLPGSNVLLVATNVGVFRSIDGGEHFGANTPSFDDRNPVVAGDITDIDLDRATPASTAYASVRGLGVLVSTDGGITFPAASNLILTIAPAVLPSRVVFAQSVQPNSDTFYVAITDNSVSPPILNTRGLFKSTDRGVNWTAMPDASARAIESATAFGANGNQQADYNLTLGVDPLNANIVYIAFQQLFVSTDGAATFGTPAASLNQLHYDHHVLIFSPHAPGGAATTTPVYAGTDGGIARSSDGGVNWTNLNATIATNLFLGIDIGRGSAANNGTTYGGCQDTGTSERLPAFAGTDWHLGIDGDGGPVAVDTANPQRAYGRDNGLFVVTSNGGTTWTFPTSATTGLLADAFGRSRGTPLTVDLNSSANVYVSEATQLFQSTDTGATFTAITFVFPSNIRTFAQVKLDSNTAMIGCAGGSVFRTTDLNLGAGSNWTDLTPALTAAGAQALPVGGIAIDPTDKNTAVVVFDGFTVINPVNRTQHVFRTTDGGVTWTDISGTDGAANPDNNLPDLPLHAVVINPTGPPHTIIVAGDSAVLRSVDNGATWQIFGVGLPTVDCTSLVIDAAAVPAVIRVGTYGRSVFEIDRPTGPVIAVQSNLAFGSVAQGSNADLVVQVFNVGSLDLVITDFVEALGSGDFQLVAPPAFPLTIAPGIEVDFTLRFAPTTGGNQKATFHVFSNDPTESVFQIRASGSSPSFVPEITSVAPSIGPTAGGTSVVISGTRFTGATAVVFGTAGATGFTVDSDNQITAITPPGSGVVGVFVISPTGTSVPAGSALFNFVGGGPAVASLSPDQGPETGGTAVTITGGGFAGATQVLFGAIAATSMTVDSGTQITAISPTGNGTVDVFVATPAGTSGASAADRFTYVVSGGGVATGTGTTTSTATGGLGGAPDANDEILSALAEILRTGTDPEVLEAQRILLRRIALGGDVIQSRIPAPKNITEIGGYINLLATLDQTELRLQMLASLLGVAGESATLARAETGPLAAFISLQNDRPDGAAQALIPPRFTMRSDMIDAFQEALQIVHGVGCAVPFLTPPRALPRPLPGSHPPVEFLPLLGRTIDVVPGTLLGDPANDPLAIARRASGPPDAFQLVARELDGGAKVAEASWIAFSGDTTSVTAQPAANRRYLPLNLLFAAAGWYPVEPVVLPTSAVKVGSLTRFINITGLVRGETRLGDELALIYLTSAIMTSSLVGQLSWTWNGTTFVPPR